MNLPRNYNGTLVIVGSPEQLSTSRSTRPSSTDITKTKEVMTTTLDIGRVLSFFLNKSGKTLDCIIIPRKFSLARYASIGSGTIQMVQAPRIQDPMAVLLLPGLAMKLPLFITMAKKPCPGKRMKRLQKWTLQKTLYWLKHWLQKIRNWPTVNRLYEI